MNTKIKKIIAFTIVLIMIMATSSQAVTIWLCKNKSGEDTRSNGTIFKFDSDKNGIVRNIQDYKIDDKHSYFCLMGGQRLQDVYGYNYGTYDNKTDIKNGKFSGLKDNYTSKGFEWLIKNMYTASTDEESSNYMLENLNKVINIYADNGYKDYKVIDRGVKIVDTEFIEVIEQLLIWKLVKNNNSVYTHEDMITSEADIAKIKLFNNGTVGYGESGNKIGYAIYSALLNGTKDEGKKYSIAESSDEYKITLQKSSTTDINSIQGEQNTYVMGPITLKTDNANQINNITGKLNIETTSIQYVSSKTASTVIGTNVKDVLNKTFYIKFKTKEELPTNTKVTYSCTADFEYRISSMEANLYTQEDRQPILEVNKTLKKESSNKSVSIFTKDLDLALTKQITKVFRYNDTESDYKAVWGEDPNDNRLLKIDTSTIESDGDATYKMNKTPLNVQVGDIVEYTITVYNEGSKRAFIEEITDYLPNGLRILKTEKIDESDEISVKEWNASNLALAKSGLKYDSENNIVKFSMQRDLEPYTSGEESFKNESMYQIKFECIVTNEAKIGDILTNVAEITKYGSYEGENKRYANSVGYDIDSEQNNVFNKKSQEQSDIEYYEKHIQDLVQENKYSVQNVNKPDIDIQDDDDFEQIKIGTFDMALRKFITNVTRDGENIDIGESREPKIGVYSAIAYIKEGTGRYYHTKEPISVKVGDLVTYTIRVYNEGFQDGYAQKVTDYLPEGLKFVSATVDGKDYGWNEVEGTDGRVIETTYLQDELIKCANGEYGFAKITALQSIHGDEIPEEFKFWKDLKVVCEVVKGGTPEQLTNVAEITKYGYYQVENKQNGVVISSNFVEAKKDDGEADIDSYQDNVFKEKDIKNVEEYNIYQQLAKKDYSKNKDGVMAYKGIEDDDDFENVVAEQLGTYKFILNKVDEKDTSIDGARFTIGKDGEILSNNEIINGNKTIEENSVNINKVYTYTVKENASKDGYLNILEDNIIHIGVVLNEDLKLELSTNMGELYQQYIEKYGYYITDKNGKLLEDSNVDLYTISVDVNNESEIPEITVKVPNKKLTGSYSMEILKTKENNEPLSGVSFKVKEGTKEENTYGPTKADGKVTIVSNKPIETVGVDKYTITEIVMQDNPYISIKDDIDIYITKEVVNKNYEATKVSFEEGNDVKSKQVELQDGTRVTVVATLTNGKVTITIPNNSIEGQYDLTLIKVDQKDGKTPLAGVTFDVTVKKDNKEVTLYDVNGNIINTKGLVTDKDGKINLPNIKITEEATYKYEIVETKVPEGYIMLKDSIKLTVKTGIENYEYVIKNSEIAGVAKLDSTKDKITVTVQNGQFDLALRKFITGLTTGVGTESENKQEITTRIPVFKIDENGDYVYEHTKEPLVVGNQNIVEYTIRVYNEGSIAGYAKEIKDDIPQGLEFIPEDETNKQYRWLMLDEEGNETDDVSKAKYITSDYLSKEQENTAGENLLKPFDIESYNAGSIKEPDYKEVKVAFKVTLPNKSEDIVINQAQISDDCDEDGNEITDKDSIPDEWIDGEDDQDIEKIKVQYFDLALRKWVTKAIVIEDGKETVTDTGHKAEDDPEAVVKVDLKKSKIDNVVVKFEYQIRVINEGQIPGSVEEISDYIPQGLKFEAVDNPNWEEQEGKVVTNQLAGKILEPGESAEVTIRLTWINREDNMGLKVNIAEISKDYNEFGSPDIDSTPNNKVPGEDDIDDAPVMLTVKTGQIIMYTGIVMVVLVILAGGIISIKKFVIK